MERKLLSKVWGGRALEDTLGLELPADGSPIGESWEVYDRPEGSSPIRGSDETLGQLVRRCPEELVGHDVRLGHEGAFPLTLKFLDAREACSLQVHPSDEQAHDDIGKDECCLILRTDERANFVHGVRDGVEPETFFENWTTDAVHSMLYSFRPEPGQFVHTRPGVPHSMGPGVVAFEVQQNSDQTYRINDWGRGRETALAEARAVIRLDVNHAPPVERSTSLADGGELLLVTEHFAVRRYEIAHRVELATHGRFLMITCLSGSGRVRWSSDASLAIGRADTVLVPASHAMVALEPDGQIDFVVSCPGNR